MRRTLQLSPWTACLSIFRWTALGWAGLSAAASAAHAAEVDPVPSVNLGGPVSAAGIGGLPPAPGALPAAPGPQGLAPAPPGAQPLRRWTFSAGAGAELTFTNNIALAPSGQEESDLVLGLSLPMGVRHASPRVKLLAEYTPTVYLYAQNHDSNYVQNNLRAFASLEAVDDFLFVDALASSFPTYASPFLPRPGSGVSITDNRVQQTIFGVSPYIRHRSSNDWTYLLRSDNFWNGYDDPTLASTFASRLSAVVDSAPTRLNYGFDYTYLYIDNEAQPKSYYDQIARFRPGLRATRTAGVSARLGYESNDYVTPRYSGAVYGVGVDWVPNPRTRLDGFVEHRFFGTSYALNLNYRTRRTVWRLRGARDLTTTIQQQVAGRPVTTAELLGDAFLARVPDPVRREEEVKQFLNNAGLWTTLTQPYGFYTDQVYLSEQWTGSVVFLGRRNTLELSVFWQDNESIPPPANSSLAFIGFEPFTQQSFTLRFSHRLTRLTSATFTANRLHTEPTGPTAATRDETTQDTLRVGLVHRLGERTDGSVAVQWTNFDSLADPYQETSLIAAVAHTF